MRKITLLVASFAMTSLLFAPGLAYAQTSGTDASSKEACQTLQDINPDGKGCRAAAADTDSLITVAIELLSITAGIIAVIMIIVSVLKFMTSQGDASKIASARQSLIYAIVGLVVVAFAQIIVRFFLSNTTQ